MAFGIGKTSGTIEVIFSGDTAVTCSKDDYKEYIKTLDESILRLKEGVTPTRFVLKRVLDWDAKQNSNAKRMTFQDGQPQPNLAFILEDVRGALVDIKDPGENMEFKQEGDGFASKRLISMLDDAGVVAELYNARINAGHERVPKKS